MNGSPTQPTDPQHPWIGLASFTEGDRQFFAGRGDEIEQLLRLVRRDTLTLLYGISGLGKTSLLQAGLFPALRNENYLPVTIRLDFLESAPALAKQVFNAIAAAAAEARVDAPQLHPGETLWEYFHRLDNHFWSPRHELVTPFLIFDQFEEFFTLGRETADRNRRGSDFISELADLVENRPPASLRDDPARAREFNFKPTPLKVLLSMREDYLGDLDFIRSKFRALTQNRLRLLPMGERQAREVIELGASLLANGVEDRIVKYVAGASANGEGSEITVAPALLSLVLRELNERRLRGGPDAKITPDLLDLEQEKILDDFYLRTLKDFPGGVRTFVEDKLLTAGGHRNSCALDDALTRPDVTQPILNQLVDRRLLAYEDRHNTRRVEITHDVLLPVIKTSRDIRLTSEARAEADRLRASEAAQRRKQQITTAVACALALLLIATVWGGNYAFFQEHKAYYREFSKLRGFPVGIGPLSQSAARNMPVSFLLVHKGMVRDGWKLHWKPAFRVQALNGLLELTTNHSVFPYLWKGELESQDAQDETHGKGEEKSGSKNAPDETLGKTLAEKARQLGLKTVSQWEFVSTTNGEIIYERALDRKGRMVYGLIYSPPESGSPLIGLTRLVGPNGFPQLQRTSAAEYVEIHYNEAGWEERIMYRDSKGLAAAGPDGAFGQSMQYDGRGRLTGVLSLDANGRRMIDNSGNCGTEVKYDNDGREVEETFLGLDLKPIPLKDGYVTAKMQYDRYGRLERMTFHGLKGEPVVSKNGYHGFEAKYDEHGNETVETYLGKDGKPMSIGDGYATVKSTYDSRGKLTRISFHGVMGEPVLSKKYGYHGWEAKYDEHGNETVGTYLGKDGKPTAAADGYATMRSTYDARDNLIRVTFQDVNGEPVLSKKNGYYGWEAEYDEQGNKIISTYLGKDGKPMPGADGYATLRMAYDSRGDVIRVTFHGANGEAVKSEANGYYGWEAEYGERGDRIVTTILGEDGKPMQGANGYATIKSAYDSRGNVIRETFYGVNGEPVLSKKNGYYGREADYDKHDNPTLVTYMGPTAVADGYAIFKSSYDQRGNKTRETYYGPNGEPVLSKKDGCHGWEAEYDEQGNQTVITYLGLDGKSMSVADGYATLRMAYDSRGKVIQQTLYGVNGEPVQHKAGYYGWEAEYDEQGNQIVETYLGKDGTPMPGADGYVTLRLAYDSRGNVIRVTYHAANGDAVKSTKDGYYGWEAKYDEQGNKTMTYLAKDGKPIAGEQR